MIKCRSLRYVCLIYIYFFLQKVYAYKIVFRVKVVFGVWLLSFTQQLTVEFSNILHSIFSQLLLVTTKHNF